MDDEVHNHLVVEEHDNGWDVVSEFLLDSLDFSLQGVDVGADAGLENEVVEGLVSLGGGWVLWVFDIISLCWEWSWVDVSLLQSCHIGLYSSVDLGIKFSIFSHLLECFMLIGSQGVFECEISCALISYK